MLFRDTGTIIALSGLASTAQAQEKLQSALAPASDQASGIAVLWWAMLIGAIIIFAAVMVVLGTGLWWARRKETRLSGIASRNLVITAGVAIPLLVLIFLVGGSLFLGKDLSAKAPDNAQTIEVIGWRWWWEIRYLDENDQLIATTANEMHVPVDRPVRLVLKSGDVIHSFWVPNLHGKTDLMPGKVNTSWFTAKREGVFYGQCAEFCGTQHALMGFRVMAQPEPAFAAWLARQAENARAPTTEQQALGRQVFVDVGCAACHDIRGVTPRAMTTGRDPKAPPLIHDLRAMGKADLARQDSPIPAPDLTHFGSRTTLAAGARPATKGHIGGWLTDPQGIKPGALMPPTMLEPQELHALVAYLQSLE